MRKTLDKLYEKKNQGFILLLGSRFVVTDNVAFLVPKLTTKSTRDVMKHKNMVLCSSFRYKGH